MSAMKRAVDAADQAADAPVTLAQNRVDEIRNSLVTPGDAAQEERNTRTRDRMLRRLSTVNDQASRDVAPMPAALAEVIVQSPRRSKRAYLYMHND